MKSVKILVSIPAHLKTKLDTLRKQGTTSSGFIRNLVVQHFATEKQKRKTA